MKEGFYMDLQAYVCWKYGVDRLPPYTLSTILEDCRTAKQFKIIIQAVNSLYVALNMEC